MKTGFLPTVFLQGRVKSSEVAKIKTMQNCLDACAVDTPKRCIDVTEVLAKSFVLSDVNSNRCNAMPSRQRNSQIVIDS